MVGILLSSIKFFQLGCTFLNVPKLKKKKSPVAFPIYPYSTPLHQGSNSSKYNWEIKFLGNQSCGH